LRGAAVAIGGMVNEKQNSDSAMLMYFPTTADYI
jgi:hypothetical protein